MRATILFVALLTLSLFASEIKAHQTASSFARRSRHKHIKSAQAHKHSHAKPTGSAPISKGSAVATHSSSHKGHDKASGTSSSGAASDSGSGSTSSSAGSGSGCTFTTVAALEAGKKSCKSITLNNIKVPAGQTLDLTGLAPQTAIIFAGNTTFEYKEWKGPLIAADGSPTISGTKDHVIDCGGARWWDGKGSNGGKTKPKFFALHSMSNTVISNLNIMNTPVQGTVKADVPFSISDSSHLTLNNIKIDDTAGDKLGGHNTDCFDVGTSNFITINNATCFNQDDCLAVNSGTDINFIGGDCNGGHGISIGSVGNREDNTVARVNVTDCKVVNSLNGARVKTIAGATGKVDSVTFRNIQLSGITGAGIVIAQDYQNGGPTGKPTSGVPITNLRMIGVTGTVDDKAMPVQIKCGQGSCKDWAWDSDISGGTPADTKNCINAPPSAKCS